MTGIPPVRRRLLGAALRRYRENLGYGLEEAARVLECDKSKVSRIETGQRGIRPKELRELLTEYGVTESEQTALVNIGQRGRQRGWWQEFAEILPEASQDYLLMEAAASQVLAWAPHQIPDLLQTPGYAGALADTDPRFSADRQRAQAVSFNTERQRVVLGEQGLRLEVIIAEAALHQQVGGAEVMRGQLSRLASAADQWPGVTVQVIGFTTGAHAVSGSGPLGILRFADAPSVGVVYLACLGGGVCLETPDAVAAHVRAFTQLRSSALSPDVSAQLLRDMARD